MVIFIHVRFPGLTGLMISKMGQYAVPVFFMISGYYSYTEDRSSLPVLKRRTVKILKITIWSLSLYFVFSIIIHLFSDDLVEWLKIFADYKIWLNAIILNDFDIIHGSPLWFLPSLLYAYIILAFIEKTNSYRIAYKLLPVLFLLRIVLSVIVWFYGLSWHLRCNVLIDGLPWVLLGNYFAYKREIIQGFSSKRLLIYSIAGGFFAVLMVYLDRPIDLSEIGIVIYAASLFMLALNNPQKTICKRIEYLGDNGSLYVYIFHIMIAWIVNAIVKLFVSQDSGWYLWMKPVIVAVIAVMVAIAITKYKNRITT